MNATDTVTVRILGFPLADYRQSLEHGTELLREFALIALSQRDDDSRPLPARLVELVDALTRDYAGVTDAVDAQRDEPLEAGLESVDLTYEVPPGAAEASQALSALLDEADDYCRDGGALLTLATPPETKVFRKWYLGEFVNQVAGGAPTPWPDYVNALSDRR